MLSKMELAREFKVSISTIDRWMKNGMPRIKVPNGTVRFDIEKVKSWFSSNTKGE